MSNEKINQIITEVYEELKNTTKPEELEIEVFKATIRKLNQHGLAAYMKGTGKQYTAQRVKQIINKRK